MEKKIKITDHNLIKKAKTWCRETTIKYINSGKLQNKPCEICGNEKSQSHHLNYSDPRKIIWLCSPHHRLWHKQNKIPQIRVPTNILKEIERKKDALLMKTIKITDQAHKIIRKKSFQSNVPICTLVSNLIINL